MKALIIFMMLILFVGCNDPKPEPLPKPEIVYNTVYKTKKVKVAVPCDLPKPTCEFKGPGFIPAIKMSECIVKQKRYIEACSERNITVTDQQ